MSIITVYDGNNNIDDLLQDDDEFIHYCKISKEKGESGIISLSDKWGNTIELWDHQRDYFIDNI